MPASNVLKDRVKAIKDLLGLFRLERLVYVTVTLVSVLILMSCAVIMLIRGNDPALAIGLFGGSGGILYTSGRLLKMWSDALRLLDPAAPAEAK